MIATSGFDIDNIDYGAQDFRVLRLIHESEHGFCRVFECIYHGRHVVAKCLNPEYVASHAHIELLRREYELIASLYHPCIIQTYGFEELPGEGKAIILEYADGVTLRALMESGEIDGKTALSIIRQICTALDYCHRHGIVHRDLKPENIMVLPEGPYIKIIDFNFSHGSSFADPVYPGGTPGYSAPEQFDKEVEASPRADIWSVGKIMAEMRPRNVYGWQKVAERCMSENPVDRPASVSEILLLIERFRKKRSVLFGLGATAAILIVIFAVIWKYALPDVDYSDTERSDKISLADKGASDSAASNFADISVHDEIDGSIEGARVISDSETKDSKLNVKDLSSDAALQGNGRETLPSVLDADVIKFARSAAARQFEKHLNILDTVTDASVFNLCYVGHWRWLAKQEVSRWVDAKNISAELKQQLKKVGENAVVEYEKEHLKQNRDAIVQCKHRVKSLFFIFPAVSRKEYAGNGEYRELRYGEDGKWSEVPSGQTESKSQTRIGAEEQRGQ